MSRLILDAESQSKFKEVQEHLELCDVTGKTIGHYFPDAVYRKLACRWANAQVSDSTLDAAAGQNGGGSLQAIWARLGRK